MRRFILRENISEVDIAKWINAMNEVAESTRLGIPVLIASNSRNENAERTFGMNDAVGVALVFMYPKSGNYFSATPGLLELALCENKTNTAVDGSEYQETTISNIDRLFEIERLCHKHGGKFVVSVNTVMPWLFDSIEPKVDGLVAHFETLIKAQFDVFSGKVSPSGVLPITLPASAEVIAVDQQGECVCRGRNGKFNFCNS